MKFLERAGLETVHFVGVGGAGMSAIAEILLDKQLSGHGIEITGSDLVASEVTERLERLGARIAIGHRAENVGNAGLVVVSSAIRPDNPEVQEARLRGVTVIRRAEMLGELLRLEYGIAIAGTHGKTTTTSMIGTVLTDAGLDPTVLVGGRLRLGGTGARLGRSDLMVVEADEYDRSFLSLYPIIAVVTTIDVDHLDTYDDLDDIMSAFAQFVVRVPFFGCAVLCVDDPNVKRLLPRLEGRRVVSYGFDESATVRASEVSFEGLETAFVVSHGKHGELGRVRLPMPGRHNVQNALAAIAVGSTLGIEFDQIRRALENFEGVHRRFELLGTWRGASVIDDYAHHPAEVTATLQAARQVYAGRIHAVFQPHLYSRTRDLADDFGRALTLADTAWVTDIYPSREAPIAGVTSDLVVDAARSHGHRAVEKCSRWQCVPGHLAPTVAHGDAILTLGAGDIHRLAHQLVAGAAGDSSGCFPKQVIGSSSDRVGAK
jgi:UDP-N-acetylmuramate--alanine ligase